MQTLSNTVEIFDDLLHQYNCFVFETMDFNCNPIMPSAISVIMQMEENLMKYQRDHHTEPGMMSQSDLVNLIVKMRNDLILEVRRHYDDSPSTRRFVDANLEYYNQ
eukprot:NODE_1380_length_1178_cov_0.880445.p3 type:complete len:106 gc:universal NODE_1380_length_1178_cov_0.880445:136-453(+)